MRRTRENRLKNQKWCYFEGRYIEREVLEGVALMRDRPTTRRIVAHNMFVLFITDFKTYTSIKAERPKIPIRDSEDVGSWNEWTGLGKTNQENSCEI